MLKFAIYISDHGFGHASRMAALAEEFIRYGVFVFIRSARPDFLFNRLDPNYFHQESVVTDVGVKHGEELVPDLVQTRKALLTQLHHRMEIVESEVQFLREQRVDLVISDLPFLVVEACTYARVPVFAVSNFDWLFIYERLFRDDYRLKPVLNLIFGLYQRVDHAYRLPFSSPQSMAAFRSLEKVGLLASYKDNYQDIRKRFDLPEATPLLLCTFGGEGVMQIDLETLCSAFDGCVLSTSANVKAGNHLQVSPGDDFLDLFHGSDIIFTKPGYSSFAEGIQFGKYILYHPRRDYPEEEVLIKGLKSYPNQLQLDRTPQTKAQWRKVFSKINPQQSVATKKRNKNSALAASIIRRYMELKHPNSRLISVFDAGTNNLNYALCEAGRAEPLHAAQLSTGLGRDYRVSQAGNVTLHPDSIKRFKQTLSRFLPYDLGIASTKQVLGTGIARRASNIANVSSWIESRWKLPYRVITEEEELQLSYLVARNLIPPGQTALIADIGGFSSEFTFVSSDGHYRGTSLLLGLLTLRRGLIEGISLSDQLGQALQNLDYYQPEVIIGVGLTASFLAKVVKKIRYFCPDQLQGQKVSHQELAELQQCLRSNQVDDPLQFMMEPSATDILAISADYFTLLLDRFHCPDFLVCYYGIAAGYNLWTTRSRKKRFRKAD